MLNFLTSVVGNNLSVVCRCYQQWSVERSHSRRPGSGRLLSTDATLDLRIVQAAVAARSTSREDIRAPAVSPWTIGNRLLAAGLRSLVPLARLPLTLRHHQARLLWCRQRVDWRVKWCSVVSDESTFCVYVNDGRTRARRGPGKLHLLECIHLRHTGPYLRLHSVGLSFSTLSHIWLFLQDKVNSAQVLNSVLPFLGREGDGIFQ